MQIFAGVACRGGCITIMGFSKTLIFSSFGGHIFGTVTNEADIII